MHIADEETTTTSSPISVPSKEKPAQLYICIVVVPPLPAAVRRLDGAFPVDR